MSTVQSTKPQVTTQKPPAVAPVRPSVRSIVEKWAGGLTKSHAPNMAVRGPLAWVRDEKAEELIKLLAEAGFK